MPTITAQARPVSSPANDAAYRAPVKHVQASNTGMNIERIAPQDQPPVGNAVQPIKSNVPKEETQPKAVTLSPQLAAMARKEAKLRQDQQALKAERESFTAKQSELQQIAAVKERLAKKDFTALDELGVSYEEWTNYLLTRGEAQKPEAQAIKKLEEEITGIKANQEQQVNKQYEATVAQYKSEIAALVAKDPEYSTIKEAKAEGHVLQHILDTFDKDGEILTVDQASKEIEDFLVQDALEMTKFTKVKSKLSIVPQEEKKTLPPPKTGLRTLSQKIAPVAESTVLSRQMQHLSPRERLALAVQKASRGQQ